MQSLDFRARMRRVPGFDVVFDAVQNRHYRRWVAAGCPEGPPPQRYKTETLRRFAARFGLRILVETGTAWGDTIHALRHDFDRLYTIELGERIYRYACRRFRAFPHIRVLAGDSGTVIGEILKEIDAPALFWLDGHYGGPLTARGDEDSPVEKELQHVLAHRRVRDHVVLLDDARFFTGTNGYPTLDRRSRACMARKTPRRRLPRATSG